ncbi:carbohydrate ABC transporter permease [Dictyobacter kobayashii]|uniref:ABC transporter permease n=1 Tax=Dictyobacter kobayashii TaxID=2014872 RepID=A0A402ARY9_9CHLR|nr:sugar ABC transporter permease [Dictyobacter kobayashii]GCE21864.1 ABC transporter permease [Dictyobacter kobayashii]
MQTISRPGKADVHERGPVLKKGRLGRQFRGRISWKFYVPLLPLFAVLGLFSYYPALSGLYHAFFDWRPGFDSPFIGFQNFAALPSDSVFIHSFTNIIQFFIFGVTLAWIVPLFAAELVLAHSSKRWQFIFRTLLIVPIAFPMVVVFYLWGFMYEPNIGMINTMLHAIGLSSLERNWLGDPNIALYSLMFLGFPWIASTPFLLFLAGLQSIPTEIFDAASIDGASWFTRIIRIDIPLISGQFRLLFVLAIINYVQFAIPMALLTNGGPAYSTMTPALYMINQAFYDGNWGYAAALSSVLFIITALFSVISLRTRKQAVATA